MISRILLLILAFSTSEARSDLLQDYFEGVIQKKEAERDQDLSKKQYFSMQEWTHRKAIKQILTQAPLSIEGQALQKGVLAATQLPPNSDQNQWTREAAWILARQWQWNWESKNLPLLLEKKRWAESGNKLGAVLGLILLGGSLRAHPEGIRSYLQYFRTLFPVLGAGVGQGIAGAHSLPPSPAELLNLEIQTQKWNPEVFSLLDQQWITLGGATTATLTVEVLEKILPWLVATQRATTVLRVSGWLVLGSIAFELGSYGVRKGIEHYKYSERVADLIKYRDQLHSAQNETEAQIAAEGLVASTLNLIAFLKQPLFERLKEVHLQLALAEQRYGSEKRKFYHLRRRLETQLTHDFSPETTEVFSLESSADLPDFIAQPALQNPVTLWQQSLAFLKANPFAEELEDSIDFLMSFYLRTFLLPQSLASSLERQRP